MNRYYMALAVLAATLGSAGCLLKETTHRIYLSPSGAVTWTVLEESVRSDENDTTRRSSEERAWLDAIATGTHAIAEGLHRLGPDQLSTRLLRSDRPYMALAEARFGRADRVILRLFDELGLRGEAALEAGGLDTTLRVSLDLSSLDDPEPEIDSPVAALLEDLDRYRFVLTEGRFVGAAGFQVIENGSAATLQEIPDATLEARGVVTLTLTWRVARQ
jgi:hypothetical protein